MVIDKKYLTSIEITVNTECNFRCRLCTSAGMINGPVHEMKPDLFKKIVREIDQKTLLHLVGGEPLLYFLDKQFLYDEIFKNPNIILQIVTNGSVIHKQNTLLRYLEQDKSCNIIFSGEACHQGYENLRVGGDWNIFLSNISLIVNLGKKNKNLIICINYIATIQTMPYLKEFVEIMHNLGIHNIIVSNLFYSESAEKIYGINFNEHLITDIDTYKTEIKQVISFMEENKYNTNFYAKHVKGETLLYEGNREFLPIDNGHNAIKKLMTKENLEIPCCWYPYYNLNILWDGTVSSCCASNNLTLGNCENNTIYEIFNNTKISQMRDVVLSGKPPYCVCNNALRTKGQIESVQDVMRNFPLRAKYQEYIKQFQAMKEQDVDKAIEFLEEKEKETFDFDCFSSIIWNELAGVYLYRKKDYEKAEYYVNKILAIQPHHIASLTKLANILIFQKEYLKAIEKLNFLLEEKCEDPLVKFWLGYAYELQGNKDKMYSLYRDFMFVCDNDKKYQHIVETWGYSHAQEVMNNENK